MVTITTSEGVKTLSDEEARAVIDKLSKLYWWINDTVGKD